MLDFQPSNPTPVYRFEPDDEVILQGKPYKPYMPTADGFAFQPLDGEGQVVAHNHATLAAWVNRGDLVHNPGKFGVGGYSAPTTSATDGLSLLSGDHNDMFDIRRAFVMSFLKLEHDKKLNRTETSVDVAMPLIQREAQTYYNTEVVERRSRVGRKDVSLQEPGASTLLRWVRKFEKFGLSGLLDERKARGNRARRMTPDELALLGLEVQKYLSDQRPSVQTIHKNVRIAFKEANALREAEGRPLLKIPSRETVRQEIKKLNPFHVVLAREGRQAALRKFAPVGQGLRYTRPLQRVEMDEWKIDLMSLMNSAGLSPYMTDEEKTALGLDGSKNRWWLSVAICCTTRCILAMRLMREPSTESALETIEMAISDKGIFCDAVGARTPWNMFGGIEHLVTDCGAAFKSRKFAAGMSDLGIRFELAPAGIPHLRGKIERVFRTFAAQLMPLLRGRTFSDVITKGEYNPEANTVLTADELAMALVRYVVDIYHNSPHAGLAGETPFNCWQRLAGEGTLRPAPDKRKRRIVFGTTIMRTVQKTGIRILNIQYHSAELALWMAANTDTEVQVRWHHKDLGEIEVLLDGIWQTVGAVFDGFDGVDAHTWKATMRQLRAANREAAEFAEETVFKAIRDIQAMNDNAIRRGGMIVEFWDEERLVREEEKPFIGFKVAASAREQSDAPRKEWGTRISPEDMADLSKPNTSPVQARDAQGAAFPPAPETKTWSFDDE
jgi:putative transposase